MRFAVRWEWGKEFLWDKEWEIQSPWPSTNEVPMHSRWWCVQMHFWGPLMNWHQLDLIQRGAPPGRGCPASSVLWEHGSCVLRSPSSQEKPETWMVCEMLTMFKNAYLLNMLVCLVAQSCPTLLWPPWTVGRQDALPIGFTRQRYYWSGLPCLSPGNLPDPGIEPESPTLQADSLPFEPLGRPS